MSEEITFQGRRWKLHRATDERLIFHALENPDGKKLLAWRTKKKLNQRAAAKELGISQGQLARIESGTRNCPDEILSLLK